VTVYVGLHEDTNSNAAAVDAEGRILGAVAEARFGRIKYQAGFPKESVRWLEASGATDGRVAAPGARPAEAPSADRVLSSRSVTPVAANPYHPIPRLLEAGPPDGKRDFRSPVQTVHVAWHEALFRSEGLRRRVAELSRRRLEARWDRPVSFIGHHVAHAASAYYTAPWPEATVVTCDNLGDGECARVFHGRGGHLEPLWAVGAWHSPGQFYGEVASFLGIDPMTAGKVTGMAARGNPEQALRILLQRFRIAPDRRGFRGPSVADRTPQSSHWDQLAQLPKEDVAAGAQQALEDGLIPFIQAAVARTGCKRVALAGGVFGNVTLNRKIAALPEVEQIWVHPAMSDQGIALGAALLALARAGGLQPRAMEHVYLGPSWTEADCARALEQAGEDAERPDDLAEAVADLLEQGKAVARFDGALEYGPRALGNRSILVRPDAPDVNDWLNERLSRSEYMPFAPVTLAGHEEAIYQDLDAVRPCLPFMTVAVQARNPRDPRFRGVVHVDGTCRPQVVGPDDNPGYHAILERFWAKTGIPSLVNTSFNRHGEPIVCTPGDAIESFRGARLDALVLGPFLVVA
jgi:carbamoyltransferase